MNHSDNVPVVYVRHEIELQKVVAFVRARVADVHFVVEGELIDAALACLEELAREHNIRIEVCLTDPSGTRMLLFGAVGAGAGALVGATAGGVQGGVIGAAVGVVAGCVVASLTVTISISGSLPPSAQPVPA